MCVQYTKLYWEQQRNLIFWLVDNYSWKDGMTNDLSNDFTFDSSQRLFAAFHVFICLGFVTACWPTGVKLVIYHLTEEIT